VLLVHNYYQHAGGEGRVFAAEADLLSAHGHHVSRFTMHNDRVQDYGPLALVRDTLWNKDAYHDLSTFIQQEYPQIVHFYNTFPLISPAAYYACQAQGLPVIQTVQNYRQLCPNALFLRQGHVCEDCLGKKIPWPGVLHACYRNSRAQTAAVVGMLVYHRWRKTWQEQIDTYVAISGFSQRKLVSGGLPAAKFVCKPNFVHPDPGPREDKQAGQYALYVGRLSREKGIHTLLKAWVNLPDIPLKIVGDGPLHDETAQIVQSWSLNQVKLVGRRTHDEIPSLIKEARFVVIPSECYENLPLVILEAFACGVPVIASQRGAMTETVTDGQTGLHFAPGDPADLAEKAKWAWANPQKMAEMGQAGRHEFETKYTAEENYRQLMDIYQAAITRKTK
jgi:glycosyltransferase involved in cell wall biosynthesis